MEVLFCLFLYSIYDFVVVAGFKHPGSTQVPARSKPAAGERGKDSLSAGSVCHRHSSAASVHPGDQDQEHDLQDQTQAGLHSACLRRKVTIGTKHGGCQLAAFENVDSRCFLLVQKKRGKIVLGYTEAELRVRGSGYQFIHAADMLYCAENHVRSKSPAI